MTDIYISYEWRIVLCAIFMLHIRLLYRTTAEKVKGVHRMRVEQQSQNIIDVVKQSIGPEEKSGAVLSQYTTGAAGAAVEKSSVSDNAKSVNLKDATYAKPAAEDKQTVAEEIEASATLDAEERKNQMAVLSNTTSPEDYAKMQEDGFSLDDTTTNTIVTETDKIKAQLAKAGVDISFFGDDLDYEQMAAITGSEALARQLAQAMKEADLPCTEENVRGVMEALSLAQTLQTPGDGAVKYMLDNGMEPTIGNLYKAEYSGSAAYQANPEAAVDMTMFSDQIDAIIARAGLSVDDTSKEACQWLLDNSVPLNEENLAYYMELKNLSLPVQAEALLGSMAAAVAEGKSPQDALLVDGQSFADKAQDACDVIGEATDEDVAYVVDHGMELNIRSLKEAMAHRSGEETADSASGDAQEETAESSADGSTAYTQRELDLLTARRQLEETRLAMTAQANYALLKKGIQIDTQPLAELVEALKETENQYYEQLLKGQGVEASETNVNLFRETTERVNDLKTVPAYVLGAQGVKDASVAKVHDTGRAMRDTFERANQSYETLMTAPRADLGDSIQKAFRNVDDILSDIGLEETEANQRAVRILGYNQIEITQESVAEMKAADEQVQRVFRNLTPATVTEMIRRGIDPLDMDFSTLNATAEQIKKETGANDERGFGEFLWKLERTEGISQEERASYIGTYRLIHQVEQSDGAAVGALVNQGADITMRNLMMAVRSERRSGKMDYSVDESFGKVEGSGYSGTSITDQMEAAYQNNCVKDVADLLTPERMKVVASQTPDWEEMTPEQLKEALAQAQTDDARKDYAYAKEQLDQLSQSAKMTQDIYTVLQKYDIPNTMTNVMAMEAMVNDRNGVFRQIFGESAKGSHKEENEEQLARAKEQVLEEFGEAIASPEGLAAAQEQLAEVAENVMNGMIDSDDVTSLDIREMRLLSAQLSIGSMMAKEEQYAIPVQTESGVVGISLKVVRGDGEKGLVDITMETKLHGKIAATFQAKEHGVSGLIASDREDTKELLDSRQESLTAVLDSGNEADLHYACIADLDLNHFSTGVFGVDAPEQQETTEKQSDTTYQVQTTRLYHIAESFVRQVQDLLQGTDAQGADA